MSHSWGWQERESSAHWHNKQTHTSSYTWGLLFIKLKPTDELGHFLSRSHLEKEVYYKLRGKESFFFFFYTWGLLVFVCVCLCMCVHVCVCVNMCLKVHVYILIWITHSGVQMCEPPFTWLLLLILFLFFFIWLQCSLLLWLLTIYFTSNQ